MKYSDIKQALYNSEAMENVADGWHISVPFLCRIKKNTYDAFACTVERENARLVKLLLVDSMTGKVDTMEPREVAETFGLDTLTCEADQIEDYDRYLADVDRYEELYDENYSDLIRDLPVDNASALELGELLVKSVGKIFFQRIIARIADDFLNRLMKKKKEQPLTDDIHVYNEEDLREEEEDIIAHAVKPEE